MNKNLHSVLISKDALEKALAPTHYTSDTSGLKIWHFSQPSMYYQATMAFMSFQTHHESSTLQPLISTLYYKHCKFHTAWRKLYSYSLGLLPNILNNSV